GVNGSSVFVDVTACRREQLRCLSPPAEKGCLVQQTCAAEKAVSRQNGKSHPPILGETAYAQPFYHLACLRDTLAYRPGVETGPARPCAQESFVALASACLGHGPAADDLGQRRLRSRTLCHGPRRLCRLPSTRQTPGQDSAGIPPSPGPSASARAARLVRGRAWLLAPGLAPRLALLRLCRRGLRRLASGMPAQCRTGKTLGLLRQETLGTDAVYDHLGAVARRFVVGLAGGATH